MKKILSLIIVLLMLSTLTIVASAANDSVIGATEEYLAMSDEDSQTIIQVVKCYEDMHIAFFAQRLSIHEMIESSRNITYFVCRNSVAHDSTQLSSIYFNQNGLPIARALRPEPEIFFENAIHSDELFASANNLDLEPNLTISETYCLDSNRVARLGMFIYYVTNQGDFVYYKQYPESTVDFLVPLEEFCEFADEVVLYYQTHPDTYGGDPTEALELLEPYIYSGSLETPLPVDTTVTDVHTEPNSDTQVPSATEPQKSSFNPIHLAWIIPLSVIVIAAIPCIIFIAKRRNRKK